MAKFSLDDKVEIVHYGSLDIIYRDGENHSRDLKPYLIGKQGTIKAIDRINRLYGVEGIPEQYWYNFDQLKII